MNPQYFDDDDPKEELLKAEAFYPRPPFTDDEYDIAFIKAVDYENEWGPYDITMHNGWSFSLSNKFALTSGKTTPQPGDFIRQWGGGIGQQIRGVQINDHMYSYKTNEMLREENKIWSDVWTWQKRVDFQKNEEKIRARIANLPQFFQDRIQRFINRDENFLADDAGYELFIYEEAVKLAAHFTTKEEVEAFHKLSYPEQNEIWTDAAEGHSGNTYGSAIHIAYWYLDSLEQDKESTLVK